MFDAVKVFSATMNRERHELGERVTEWIREQGGEIEIVDKTVRQSSDREYHCLTIMLFYRKRAA